MDFFLHQFKNHELPDDVNSDRKSKFVSNYWKTLMNIYGVKLRMSTSRQSQTDGTSNIMNRMIENYCSSYCSYHQNEWDELLSSAEFAYKLTVRDGLGMEPFEVDLGWTPISLSEFLFTSSVSPHRLDCLLVNFKVSLRNDKICLQIGKSPANSPRFQAIHGFII